MEDRIIENLDGYNIAKVIDDIALVYTADKKESGLLNLTTNELVSEMDNFYTIYNQEDHLFYQRKTIEEPNKNNNYNGVDTINIYDTLKKQMIVIKNTIFMQPSFCYSLLVLKKDGKYYIFDKDLYHQGIDILKYSFSNVERFGKYSLLVEVNNKKGLYSKGKGLLTLIEYQKIEDKNKVIIFSKDNQKYFKFLSIPTLISRAFDDITFENKKFNPWIFDYEFMFCRLNDLYYVYELSREKLLLKISCEEIEAITNFDNEYIFKIKKDGQYGLISVLEYPIDKIEVKTLLMPIYKNISYERGYSSDYYSNDNALHIFYLENNDGVNLYILNSNTLIPEKCKKITYLDYDCFAFYHDFKCDIISTRPFQVIIKDCLIEEKNKQDHTIVYKKNCMLGLLIVNGGYYLIPANYTKVNYLEYGFSILEENDKKNLFHYDKCLASKYDDIKIGNYSYYGYYGPAYVALKSKNLWLLANLKKVMPNKMTIEKINNELYTEILFFHDVIALRDTEKLAIYNGKLELIETFPQETPIYEVKTDAFLYAKTNKYMYVIDDWYYQYKDNKLEEIFLEDAFLQAALYESNFGYVVVNDYNKNKYYEKCHQMANLTQSDMDKLLENYWLKRKDLQEKYPHLVRKNIIRGDKS